MRPASLYAGEVTHLRLRPVRHRLAYRIFMGLFDLDRLHDRGRRVWAFGYNRPGLISFYDRDHGDGTGKMLRPCIEAALRKAGLAADGGRILLLCMPRVLGCVFNPLSVYFCHDRADRLAAIVHEVSNTYGERHFYALPAQMSADGRVVQHCAKDFRVSPLLPMSLSYSFSIEPPGATVAIHIVVGDERGPVLTASFRGVRRRFTSAAIVREWLLHPALTLKVLVGIHWEALRTWLKLRSARQGGGAS